MEDRTAARIVALDQRVDALDCRVGDLTRAVTAVNQAIVFGVGRIVDSRARCPPTACDRLYFIIMRDIL